MRKMKITAKETELPMEEALIVKRAELWLQVGEAGEALVELGRLPTSAWRHSWPRTVLAEAGGSVDFQSRLN
jgi:hypothetical protein